MHAKVLTASGEGKQASGQLSQEQRAQEEVYG